MYLSKGAIGKLIPSQKVTIIGGGISGLFVAFYLKKAGVDFELYEKSNQFGGKISTTKGPYGFCENAANAIYSNDEVYDLLSELKLNPIFSTRCLKKIIWRNAKITSPPLSLFEILSILPSIFRRPIVSEETTVQEFFLPLFGEKITNQVLAPVFAGIYAEHIETLHFKSIFKSWNHQKSYFRFILDIIKAKKKQKHKSESLSFKNGMQDLINALQESVKDHIIPNQNIETLSSNNTILCTPAHEAAKILNQKYPTISNELLKIRYNQLSSATLITKRQIPFLKKAFGVLFSPKEQSFHTLGILANSEVFSNRTCAPEYHSYTFIGKSADISESDLEQDLTLLKNVTSINEKVFINITRWKSALPIYDKNRYKSILKLRSQFLNIKPGLCLFGNYVDGISLREMLIHAKHLVDELKTN